MPRKTKAQKVVEARVNKAVGGFRIPMMSIPKMYAAMEAAIAAGADDAAVKAVVASWPGVEVAS